MKTLYVWSIIDAVLPGGHGKFVSGFVDDNRYIGKLINVRETIA